MDEDITKPILTDSEGGSPSDGGEGLKDARAIAITRLIVSMVTIINVIAAAFGWEPLGVDGETVYLIVSMILAVVANVWSWWKNNNMTKAAQAGQAVIDELKG